MAYNFAKICETCRDLDKLNPIVKVMFLHARKAIKLAGVNPLVVETLRTQERQNAIYCQGRTYEECKAKGISKEFYDGAVAYAKANGSNSKQTWTLSSKHTTARALDVVPQRKVNGKMTAIWEHSEKDYEVNVIVHIMKMYGFEPGDEWKSSRDTPHYQVNCDMTTTIKKTATTEWLTLMIQKALNALIAQDLLSVKEALVEDGKWGTKTDKAAIAYREYMGYKSGAYIGAEALDKLLTKWEDYKCK